MVCCHIATSYLQGRCGSTRVSPSAMLHVQGLDAIHDRRGNQREAPNKLFVRGDLHVCLRHSGCCHGGRHFALEVSDAGESRLQFAFKAFLSEPVSPLPRSPGHCGDMTPLLAKAISISLINVGQTWRSRSIVHCTWPTSRSHYAKNSETQAKRGPASS